MFGEDAELAELCDDRRCIYRAAAFVAGRLDGCLFIGPAAAAPQWDALKALFEAGTLDDAARRVLLSGRSTDGLASAGPIVCACFGVGLATIRGALQSGTATSVEGIGAALRAGTNCGSCLPELKRIVADPAAEATRAADAGATVSPPTARTREPSAMS
jgi:assimilatory nitrate reductase catalytic subunit